MSASRRSTSRRLLVLRGDLRSSTGYAASARAMAELLAQDFDVVGVDLHLDPADAQTPFPYPLIRNEEVASQIAGARLRPIVLHALPLDDFQSVPAAINIGACYWETDVAPLLRQWAIKLALMDAVWAPCALLADLVRGCGYAGRIDGVTWPFDFAHRRSDPAIRRALGVRMLGTLREAGLKPREWMLDHVRAGTRTLFATVQSMAPRKGLQVLLHEWHRHIEDAAGGKEGAADLLVLRLAFRHAINLSDDVASHLAEMLRDAGFRHGQDTRIAVITHTMSAAELSELFQTADAYVSTTFGEGFGGPIVEAIVNDRPVIVPRHTAMCDYIPADYPFIVASQRRLVGLHGGLPVYSPATSWHLPQPGSLARHLAVFATLSAAERQKLASGLRAHAAAFCSIPVVRHAMGSSLRALLAEAEAVTPQSEAGQFIQRPSSAGWAAA